MRRTASSSLTVDSMAHVHGKVYDAVARRFPAHITISFSSYDPTKYISRSFQSSEFSMDVPAGKWSVDVYSVNGNTGASIDTLIVERGEDVELWVSTGPSFVAAP